MTSSFPVRSLNSLLLCCEISLTDPGLHSTSLPSVFLLWQLLTGMWQGEQVIPALIIIYCYADLILWEILSSISK